MATISTTHGRSGDDRWDALNIMATIWLLQTAIEDWNKTLLFFDQANEIAKQESNPLEQLFHK